MNSGTKEAGITGALVRVHVDLLAAEFGRDRVNACIAALPPQARAQLESITAASWIPVRAYETFYEAFAASVGHPVAELHARMSRTSVEQTFKTIWRVLLRFTTDEALVSRTPLLFSRAYDTGKLSSTISTPGIARLVLTGWLDVPEIALRGTRIAVETVLRLSGRRSVAIVSERTPDGATFRATWQTSRTPAK